MGQYIIWVRTKWPRVPQFLLQLPRCIYASDITDEGGWRMHEQRKRTAPDYQGTCLIVVKYHSQGVSSDNRHHSRRERYQLNILWVWGNGVRNSVCGPTSWHHTDAVVPREYNTHAIVKGR